MSFGSVPRRPAPEAACPCGRASFAECCGPILDGVVAPNAERLMRSRYTAFSVGDAAHLSRSWHPRTRPDEVVVDDATVWTGLVIEGSSDDGETATVTFRAGWRQGRESGELHERSRFARRGGRWVYVDGDID